MTKHGGNMKWRVAEFAFDLINVSTLVYKILHNVPVIISASYVNRTEVIPFSSYRSIDIDRTDLKSDFEQFKITGLDDNI
jgi:hypothetical protein